MITFVRVAWLRQATAPENRRLQRFDFVGGFPTRGACPPCDPT